MSTTPCTPSEHERWRAERLAELTRADGWLTLVGLFWLEDGEQTVGSGGTSMVHLPRGPERLGTLYLRDGAVEWRPAGGTPQVLASDSEGKPTVVSHESLSFFVIERDGRLAVRVKDSEAIARREFRGIESFPFDPRWCVAARWDGSRAHFEIDGAPCSLGPRVLADGSLQFVFGDATSGRETYGGGRFLYTPAPQGENLALDFNRAVNPPCVFTPFAVCPLPTPDNRLPITVTAGEKTA